MKANTPKLSKYGKAAMKHIANGKSVDVMVAWWNRLVYQAEVKDGKVIFYLAESVPVGKGCYRYTGNRYIELELPVW